MASLRKRGRKWVVDFKLFGKRKLKTFSSKSEAQKFKRDLLLRPIDGLTGFESNSEVTLKEAINEYFKMVSSQKSDRTKANEKVYFERLFSFIGNQCLYELSLLDLERFQQWLRKEMGLSASSVNRHFNCYKHFFRKCRAWNYIRESPARDLRSLPEDSKTKKVWRDSEVIRVLEISSEWAREAFLFVALTGSRASEVVRLKYSDISFEDRVVTLTTFKGSGAKRTRTIPMSQALEDHLQKVKERARKEFRCAEKAQVFVNASGQPVTSTHLSREIRRLVHKCGFKDLNLHGLRHTFITKAALTGSNLEVIRKLVGHSNIRTTQGYLHLNTESLRETMEAVNGMGSVIPLKSGD